MIWTSETNLEDWKMLMLWCKTDIWSCKLTVKVSLMLENPFLVPSLCKLNHISVCFIQIITKWPANSLFPSGKAMFFFWSHPRCFGPLGKFQHNIMISIKTARVSRLSVSCDCGLMYFHMSLWRHVLCFIYFVERLTLFLWLLFTPETSRPEVFCEKGVLRNIAKFTGKHLCQGLYFNKVAGLRPANFRIFRLNKTKNGRGHVLG